MTEVLLKELSNSDIDWMRSSGRQREILKSEILIHKGETVNSLHILISGTLAVTIPTAENNILQNAFEALEQQNLDKEVTRLFSGEIIGEIPFLKSWRPTSTVKAVEKSVVLSIPVETLQTKLEQDVNFATRFYRAITILFAEKIQNTINQLGRTNTVQNQPLKDVFFIFEFLYDSDIDWLLKVGHKQQIPANTTLIHERGAVDAFHLLLDGMVSLSVSVDKRNPLEVAFAAMENQEVSSREIAKLSKGEIIGETLFTDSRLPSTTAKTVKESSILSISRRVLLAKLEQDIGFAARFYRQIASLLIHRLQKLQSQFSYSRRVYSKRQPLTNNEGDEDEIDIYNLDKIALASKRFDWMLTQLKVQ